MKEKTQCYTEYYTDREENQEILLRCLDRIYKQGYWRCYLELKGFDHTLSIFLVVKLENKLEDWWMNLKSSKDWEWVVNFIYWKPSMRYKK